jgi:fungal STAND N-terminal Goodbye domain
MEASFTELWDQAVADYLAATGRKEDEKQLLFNSALTPDDLLYRLEGESRKFSAFRDKYKNVRKVLAPVLHAVSLASVAASNALSGTIPPAAVVLGAVDFLFKAASGVSRVYDSIEDLFAKLAAFMPRLQQYMAGPVNPQLQQTIITVLVYLLQVLARAEKIAKEGRLRKFAGALLLGDGTVKDLLKKLDGLFENEGRLVGAISLNINQNVDSKTTTLLENSSRSLEMLNFVTESLRGRHSWPFCQLTVWFGLALEISHLLMYWQTRQ